VQHVTFRSGRKVRKSSFTVTSVDKRDVLARTTAHWHNESVAVPDALPASTNRPAQRNIDIRYSLTVRLSLCLSVCIGPMYLCIMCPIT